MKPKLHFTLAAFAAIPATQAALLAQGPLTAESRNPFRKNIRTA